MRRIAVPLLCSLLVAACGSGQGTGPSTVAVSSQTSENARPAPPGSLAAAIGATVANDVPRAGDVAVMTGQEFVAGTPQRVSLALFASDGTELAPDEGSIQVAVGPSASKPPEDAAAGVLASIRPPGASQAPGPVSAVVVANVTATTPGIQYIGARYTVDGVSRNAVAAVEFISTPKALGVGERAPSVPTPTLDDVAGDATRISTADPPVPSLLADSIDTLVASKTPFVVAFATPAFCTSRTCGPTVDVMIAAQQALADTGVRFIQVEPFQKLDPTLGYNAAMTAWRLETEPWVYVVGADGVIADRFEGAVGADEISAAARAVAT